MKILVVDQYFYPEEFQVNDICEQMVKDGHEVTVLTGLPNYPTGIIPEEYQNGKKRDEWYNGIHVLRCWEIPRSKGAVALIKNYMSFVLSSCIKQYKLPGDFDVVFIYETSPVTLAIAGELYAKRYNTPVFFYCLDIWPECVKVMLKNDKSVLYKYIKRLSTKIYRKADIISSPTEGFFGYFESVHKIERKRLRYLPQFANEEYLKKNFTPVDNGIIDFVFTGNVGIAQDIGGLISAVEGIRDIPGFKVHIVGNGSFLEEAKGLVKEKGLEELIVFYGRRPYEEMVKFYKLADVCLVTLQAASLLNLTMPAKVQGYMAAGKPILAALTGSSREIIEDNMCGLCVTPGNVEELKNAMKEYIYNFNKYADYGANGRRYCIDNFTKATFMKNLYSQIDEAIAMKRDGRA